MYNKVYESLTGIGQQYLVHGISGFLLIDTGLRYNYEKLLKFLKKENIRLSEIEMIIITHADGDHFGCLNSLINDLPSVVTAASSIEAEAIVKGISSRELKAKGIKRILLSLLGPLFKSEPAEIRRIINPGDVFPYLDGLEILDTKGHTPGHISLWSHSTRTLFSGDSIVFHGNSLSPSTGSNTWNEDLSKVSFNYQMALKPDRIYGGHGIWKRT